MDAPAAANCRAGRGRYLLLAVAGVAAGYGLHGLYRRHGRRVAAVLSLADALSLVAADLAAFLRSESDDVPRSLLQLSKLAASDPVCLAASRVAESVASGFVRGLSVHHDSESNPQTPFRDRILDRLLSPAGTGFASAVVGSFARNLVIGLDHRRGESGDREEPEWLAALSSARGREAAAELVRVFVSTAVAAYLDRTMAVSTCDEVLTSITSPKHEAKVKDLLVSVCNGAVETFIRASRQVAVEAGKASNCSISRRIDHAVEPKVQSFGSYGVMERVSTTLAVPSNRRFVLDVTGRVTAETVRSFLQFLAQRVSDGARKSIGIARDETVERGMVAVKYLSAKSMAIFTICFALCMHISIGTRFLLPA